MVLVMISPLEVRTMPEPISDSSSALVSRVTTLGNTLAATCSTDGGAEKLDHSARRGRTRDDQLPADGGWDATSTATANRSLHITSPAQSHA